METRAKTAGNGRLRLSCAEQNEAPLGFYYHKCRYKKVDEHTKDGIKWLVLEKHCGNRDDAAEAEQEQEQEQERPAADAELDDDEEHEEVLASKSGNILTALDVWLTLIQFWATISAPVPGENGDYDRVELEKYAKAGQEAGIKWAQAMQKHSDNACNWQYVHDCLAHVRARPL